MYGFELHIQDKDYSLVADTQSEMDSWITVLCKVTGIDMDSSSCSSKTSLVSFPGIKGRTAKHVSLRESLKNSKHPELLEYAKETDVLNAKRRRECRHKLFSLIQDLDNSIVVNIDDARIDADVYKEHFGTRFIVAVDDLKFRLLTTELNGVESNVEPFFTSLALYDVKNGVKLTEDFHCDLNTMSSREMLQPVNEHITNGETNGDVELNGDALHEIEYRYPKQVWVLRFCKLSIIYCKFYVTSFLRDLFVCTIYTIISCKLPHCTYRNYHHTSFSNVLLLK